MARSAKFVVAAGIIVMSAAGASAQQSGVSRSGPVPPDGRNASAQPPLPDIYYDAARPFVGVWEGVFSPGHGESVPFVVVIEYLNGGYHGYSFLNNGTQPIQHLTDRLAGDAFTWEWRNSGGGFLVHTGRLSNHHNTLSGKLTFRDLPFSPEPGAAPTFSLQRRTPARH